MKYQRPKMIPGLSVEVRNGNFEKAHKTFQKKVQAAGIVREVRDRQQFTKPCTKRMLAKKAAVKKEERRIASEQGTKRLY